MSHCLPDGCILRGDLFGDGLALLFPSLPALIFGRHVAPAHVNPFDVAIRKVTCCGVSAVRACRLRLAKIGAEQGSAPLEAVHAHQSLKLNCAIAGLLVDAFTRMESVEHEGEGYVIGNVNSCAPFQLALRNDVADVVSFCDFRVTEG